MATERRNTRTRLLEAAERVVAADGVARLTLDAVASKADVSKGGLLYHFPNKEALISAMVLRWVDGFERDIGQRLKVEEASALGSWSLCWRPWRLILRFWSLLGDALRRGRRERRMMGWTWRWRRCCVWPPRGCGLRTCSGWLRLQGSYVGRCSGRSTRWREERRADELVAAGCVHRAGSVGYGEHEALGGL